MKSVNMPIAILLISFIATLSFININNVKAKNDDDNSFLIIKQYADLKPEIRSNYCNEIKDYYDYLAEYVGKKQYAILHTMGEKMKNIG